ncbi:MAG: response regulator, partial [Bacteroidota bacterium]
MLEVLLVEDDMLSAVDLQMMLEEIYDSINVVHRVTAREAKDYLLGNTPDVLLIDVVLETEKAGIQLVENLSENKPAVIFITAFRREDLFQRALVVD